jgi:hypothetical protein
MTRDLERRIRKLESSLPPLLTADVSWMFGVLVVRGGILFW